MLPAFDLPAFEVEPEANFVPAFDSAALLGLLLPFAMMFTPLTYGCRLFGGRVGP